MGSWKVAIQAWVMYGPMNATFARLSLSGSLIVPLDDEVRSLKTTMRPDIGEGQSGTWLIITGQVKERNGIEKRMKVLCGHSFARSRHAHQAGKSVVTTVPTDEARSREIKKQPGFCVIFKLAD